MASPGKRSRDSPFDEQFDEQFDFQCRAQRPSRSSRNHHTTSKHPGAGTVAFDTRHTMPSSDIADISKTKTCQQEGKDKLAKKQKRFLQLWYEDFAQLNIDSPLPNDYMSALAKVIHTQPRLVFEFIDQRRKNVHGTNNASVEEDSVERPPQGSEALHDGLEATSLTRANGHLPPTTLNLVQKYVIACRRRRAQNDGRRSVNTGPYQCTFGCGYRTKRAFDWRRHEETHEPQELWLCTICTLHSPFLVNRKDKFLKHVNDKHGDCTAEQVLDSSKVAFVPSAELACPQCGADSGSWDERCRHVLGHFEDEVERGMKRVRLVRDEDEPECSHRAYWLDDGRKGNEDDEHE